MDNGRCLMDVIDDPQALDDFFKSISQAPQAGGIPGNATQQVVTLAQPVLQQQQQQLQTTTLQGSLPSSSYNGTVTAVGQNVVNVQRQPQIAAAGSATTSQGVAVEATQPQIINVNVSGTFQTQPQNIYVQANPSIGNSNVGQAQTIQTITIGGKTYLIPQTLSNVTVQNVATPQVTTGATIPQPAINVGGVVSSNVVPVQTVGNTQNVTHLQAQQGNTQAIRTPAGQTITVQNVNSSRPAQLATQLPNVTQQIAAAGTTLQPKIGQHIVQQGTTLVSMAQVQQQQVASAVTSLAGRQIRLPVSGQVHLANAQIGRTPTPIQPKQPIAISPKTHVNISPKPSQITISPKTQVTIPHGTNLGNQTNNIQVIQNAAVAAAVQLQNQGNQDKSTAVTSAPVQQQAQNVIVNNQGIPIQNIVRTISVSNVMQSTRTTTATIAANQTSVAGQHQMQSLAQPIMTTSSNLQAKAQINSHQSNSTNQPQVPLAALTVAQQIQNQAQQQKLQVLQQQQHQTIQKAQPQTVSQAILQQNLQKKLQDLNQVPHLVKAASANLQPKSVQQLQQTQIVEQQQQQQGQNTNFGGTQVQPPVAVVQPQPLNSKTIQSTMQQGNVTVQQQSQQGQAQGQMATNVQQLLHKRDQQQQMLYQQALKIQKEKQQHVQILQPQQLQPQQIQVQNIQTSNAAPNMAVQRLVHTQQGQGGNTVVLSAATMEQLQQGQQLQLQQPTQGQQIQQPIQQGQQQQLQIQQSTQQTQLQPVQIQQQVQQVQQPQAPQQPQQLQQVQVSQQQLPQKLQIPVTQQTSGQQQQPQQGRQTVYHLNLTAQQRLQLQTNITNQIRQLLSAKEHTPQQKQLLAQLQILQQRLTNQQKQGVVFAQTPSTSTPVTTTTATPQQIQPHLAKLLTQTPSTTQASQNKPPPLMIRTVTPQSNTTTQVTAATTASLVNVSLPDKLQIRPAQPNVSPSTVVAATATTQIAQTATIQTPANVKSGQMLTLTPQQKLTVKQIQEQIKTMTPEQQQQFYKHQQALLLRIQAQSGGTAVRTNQPTLMAKVSGIATTTQTAAPVVTLVKQQAPLAAKVPIHITQVGKGINQIKTLTPAVLAQQSTAQTVQQALQQQLQVQNKGIKRPAETQLTKRSPLGQQLLEDQHAVLNPTFKPFKTRKEGIEKLMKYHVINDTGPDEKKVKRADEIFETVSEHLLDKMDRMLRKYRLLLFDEAQRKQPSAEMVMIERMFIQDEKQLLQQEKTATLGKQGADKTLPTTIQIVKSEKFSTNKLSTLSSSTTISTPLSTAVGVATATTAYLQPSKSVTSQAKMPISSVLSSAMHLTGTTSSVYTLSSATSSVSVCPVTLSATMSVAPVTLAAAVTPSTATVQVMSTINAMSAPPPPAIISPPALAPIIVTAIPTVLQPSTAVTTTTPAKLTPVVSPTIKPQPLPSPVINVAMPTTTATAVSSAISVTSDPQQETKISSSTDENILTQNNKDLSSVAIDTFATGQAMNQESSAKVKLKTESEFAVAGLLDNTLCTPSFEMIDIEALSPMETNFDDNDNDDVNDMFRSSLDTAEDALEDDVFDFDTDKLDVKVPEPMPDGALETPKLPPPPRILLKSELDDGSFADGILSSPAPELLNEQMQSAISSILDLQRPPSPDLMSAARRDLFSNLPVREERSAIEQLLQDTEDAKVNTYHIPEDVGDEDSSGHVMLTEEDFLANTGASLTEDELSGDNMLGDTESEDPALEEAIKSIMM